MFLLLQLSNHYSMVNPLSHAVGYAVASVGPCFVVSIQQANIIQWDDASMVIILLFVTIKKQ